MEATKTPDAEFKTMLIRTLKNLRERIDDFSENFKKKK